MYKFCSIKFNCPYLIPCISSILWLEHIVSLSINFIKMSEAHSMNNLFKAFITVILISFPCVKIVNYNFYDASRVLCFYYFLSSSLNDRVAVALFVYEFSTYQIELPSCLLGKLNLPVCSSLFLNSQKTDHKR